MKLPINKVSQRLAIVRTLLVLAAAGGVVAISNLSYALQTPELDVVLRVDQDGSAPFDGTTYDVTTGTNGGMDANTNNGIVRVLDYVRYRAEVSVNGTNQTNVVTRVTLDEDQQWTKLPNECLTNNERPGINPQSSITNISGSDKRVLICNLGDKTQGTKVVFHPVAQVKGDATNATIADEAACSAIPTTGSLDIIGGCVSATSSVESDTADEVNSSYVSTLTTATFRINLTKDVPVNSSTGYYQPSTTQKAGPTALGLGNGLVVDWIVKAQAQKGSERIQGNGSGERTFVLTDTFVDNNPNNNAGAADGSSHANRSSNARLYSWNPNLSACQPIGTSIGSINCTQAGSDGSNSTDAGAPITVTLNDVNVNYPDTPGQVFYFKLRVWVPIAEATAPNNHDVMSNTGSCVSGVCSLTLTNNITGIDTPDPGIDGVSPVITSITGQQNYNGTGEPTGDNTFDAPMSSAQGLSLGTIDKAYYGFGGSHPGTKTAAAGEVISKGVTISMSVDSVRDRTIACDPLDTSQLTFVGAPGDGEPHDVPYFQAFPTGAYERYNSALLSLYPDAVYLWETNPTLSFAANPALNNQVAPANLLNNNSIRLEYTDVAHSTALNDLRTYQCTDDLDGDTNNDWVTDYNSLPGGADSVTAVRFVWENMDWDELKSIYTKGDPNSLSAVGAGAVYNVRINPAATGYNCTGCSPTGSFIVDYTTGRFTVDGTTTTLEAPLVTTDTTNSGFSLINGFADRVRLVGAKTAISIELVDPNQKIINAGDTVAFKVTPYLTGQTGSPVNINLLHGLPNTGAGSPANAEFVSAVVDPSCSTDNGTYGAFNHAGNTVTTVISGVNAGEAICPYIITVRAPVGAPAGNYLTGAQISTSDATINSNSVMPFNGQPPTVYSSVQILAVDGYHVQKENNRNNYEPNETITQNLVYSNLGAEDYTTGNFIDVLPYNGDNSGFTSREDTLTPDDSRGSEYTHNDSGATASHVGLANLPAGTNGETFSYTTANPAIIPTDPCHSANQPVAFVPTLGHYCYQAYIDNGNLFVDGVAVGTGLINWSAVAPANLNDITAVRWNSTTHNSGSPARTVTLSLAPLGNQDGDIYCNNFSGRIPQIALSITSNDVCERVVSGTVSGTVFSDGNSSGGNYAANPGDGTYSGIEIQLLDGTGNPYDRDPVTPGVQPYTVTTNSNGQYSFTGLPSGTYQTEVVNPPTPDQAYDLDNTSPPIPAVFTTPNNSGNFTLTGPATDPDLEDVSNQTEVDFSYTGTASLAGKVWRDNNRNGQQDPGEEFIPNIPVHLLDASGNPVNNPSTSSPWVIPTDTTGNFLFADIPPGNYRVSYELPAGTACTVQHQGPTATDSDGAAGARGCITSVVTVLAGDNVINVDLGIVPTANNNTPPNAPDTGIKLLTNAFLVILTVTGTIMAGFYLRKRLSSES